MDTFIVEQTATGITLWEGEAANPAAALLAAAQAAGYDSIAEAREVASDDTVMIFESRHHLGLEPIDYEASLFTDADAEQEG